DIITAALERARTPASRAVMIGDTPYDIKAARAAGVACIAVRSGGWPDGALRGAIAVFDDVADLVQRYDEARLGTWLQRDGLVS
ncbi:MAG: HAD family hydrolase, partial [Candidatus Eremiobacteraeota bacterium]|nr:HAD family hydrolase [Candidatus Eremiobacteraeota bacterium]